MTQSKLLKNTILASFSIACVALAGCSGEEGGPSSENRDTGGDPVGAGAGTGDGDTPGAGNGDGSGGATGGSGNGEGSGGSTNGGGAGGSNNGEGTGSSMNGGGTGGDNPGTALPDNCRQPASGGGVCVANASARAGETVTVDLYAFLSAGCQDLNEAGTRVELPAGLGLTLTNEVSDNDASICGRRDYLDQADEVDTWYSVSYFEYDGGCAWKHDSSGKFMELKLQIPADATPGDYELKALKGYVADEGFGCQEEGAATSGTLRILP